MQKYENEDVKVKSEYTQRELTLAAFENFTAKNGVRKVRIRTVEGIELTANAEKLAKMADRLEAGEKVMAGYFKTTLTNQKGEDFEYNALGRLVRTVWNAPLVNPQAGCFGETAETAEEEPPF